MIAWYLIQIRMGEEATYSYHAQEGNAWLLWNLSFCFDAFERKVKYQKRKIGVDNNNNDT